MRLRSDQKGEGGIILSKRSFCAEEKGILYYNHNKTLWGMQELAPKYMHGCPAPGRNIFSLFATVAA